MMQNFSLVGCMVPSEEQSWGAWCAHDLHLETTVVARRASELEKTPLAAYKQRRLIVTDARSATWYRWDDMPKERVSDTLQRRLITGERMMLAHVYLDKGTIVPKHAHDNEQLTYILEGALRFWLGDEGERELVVSAGEVLYIPSNLPHKAEALEDTLDVDVFSPPRQDWLDRTDGYLRGKR
jgi:quercetin dioxygenase-like cupin family protein